MQKNGVIYLMRHADQIFLRNVDFFRDVTGCDASLLINAINSCYSTLDMLDNVLISKKLPVIANLVELANLSSMVGNILGAGIAEYSANGYVRNRPHAYPDLISVNRDFDDLELKMALEINRPKGHLPKAGCYIIFRYVLGYKNGSFTRGKENRGDTVWIWEVKLGTLGKDDFSLSNTDGDSGKTAVVKSTVHNEMPLVYFDNRFLPYATNSRTIYVGYN